MKISAVTVSYRTGAVLWTCLDALAAAADVAEIVIVDNGNPPADEAKLSAFAEATPKAKLVRGHGNVGFGAGCNLGARASSGEALLFINPDVALAPGAATRMAAALTHAHAPSLIGGDLRDLAGVPERGSRRARVTLWRAIASFLGIARWDPHRHLDAMPDQAIEMGAVSGALMLLRRADFDALVGFDEGYFLHVEDIDHCRRVEEAGGQVLFQPGAIGAHQRSSSDASGVAIARYKARSFARYFVKFSRSPLERMLAHLAGAALTVVLPLRARLSAGR